MHGLYTAMLKETKEIQGNGKTSCVHELEDNIAKMSICPKLIYWFSTIPIKTHRRFFIFGGK